MLTCKRKITRIYDQQFFRKKINYKTDFKDTI